MRQKDIRRNGDKDRQKDRKSLEIGRDRWKERGNEKNIASL